MTKQRAAVLDALASSTEFRSAQGWHDTLRHDGSTVGLATVYRALQALAEAGEVDSVVTDTGETLYRRCASGEEHHHHLRCRVCGRAEDIDMPEFEEWAHRMATTYGYSRIDHTVELTGVCESCGAQGHG
ncbi:Fur family transcriptional regulator [Demequina sp.]|uniref:Fur family transcriptional regulator n=1 Tax=Demequina sp. TaxID=2050685 RepID=UPI003A8C466B